MLMLVYLIIKATPPYIDDKINSANIIDIQ